MQVDPDKLDELATEFKLFSNLIEDQETGLHKEITELIQETNAEYHESYVRAQTREMEDILREIRQLAAEVTEELNDKAQVMKNAADRFSQEEAETAKLLQQEVGFALTKPLKAVSAYYTIAPKVVAYVLEEILDFILGKSRSKYHEPSINLPLDIVSLEADLTINPKVYNEQVKKLQQRLNELGYRIYVDGYFGKQTLAAVNDYKNKMGLVNQDEYAGMVEHQTWLCLFGGLTGELKLNPKKYSELVRMAQIRLNELGYQIEPTGYFDEKMLIVVNEFKEANQLGNSGTWAGVIGKQTWGVLFSPEGLVVKAASTPNIITDLSVMNINCCPDYSKIIRVAPKRRGLNYYSDPFGNMIFTGVNPDKFGSYIYNEKTGLYYPCGLYNSINSINSIGFNQYNHNTQTATDFGTFQVLQWKEQWIEFRFAVESLGGKIEWNDRLKVAIVYLNGVKEFYIVQNRDVYNNNGILVGFIDGNNRINLRKKHFNETFLKDTNSPIKKKEKSVWEKLRSGETIELSSGDPRRTVAEGCKAAREEYKEFLSDPKNIQAFKNTGYAVMRVNDFWLGGAFETLVPSSGDPEFDEAMDMMESITRFSPSGWLDFSKVFTKTK